MSIRPLADSDDRDALARLAVACGSTAGGPAPAAAGIVGELASRQGREIMAWLALAEGLPAAVGFVALCRTRSGWSIPWLLVHPAVRRRGLGRKLVEHAVGRAQAGGAACVSVETLAAWADATSFWTAIGFTRQSAGRA